MRRFNCCWCWATLLDASFQVLLAQGYTVMGTGCAISIVAGAGLLYWMRHFKCRWRWTSLLDAPFHLLINLATVPVLILI
jgi:hypothetical protein